MSIFKKQFKKYASSILLVIFVAQTILLPLYPVKTEAARAVIEVGANLAKNIITSIMATISAAADTSIVTKEFVLDPLVKLMAQTLIRTLSHSIINWIQNGFEGSPLFIEDPAGFIEDAGNTAASIFLEDLFGQNLNLICEPFRRNVQINIESILPSRNHRTRVPTCTISQVVEDVNQLYEDFTAGGWPSFISIATNVNNNAFGQTLTAWDGLAVATTKARKETRDRVALDVGFKVPGVCIGEFVTMSDPFTIESQQVCTKWGRGTPGAAIESQLIEVFGESFKELQLADEFDEIITALINQGLSMLLTGGPLGSPDSRRSGNRVNPNRGVFGQSGIVQSREFQEEAGETIRLSPRLDSIAGSADTEVFSLFTDNEPRYLALKRESKLILDNILLKTRTLQTCDEQDRSSQIFNIQNRLDVINTEINESQERSDIFNELRNQLTRASNTEQIAEVSRQFRELSGSQRSEEDIALATQEREELRVELDDLEVELAFCPQVSISADPETLAEGGQTTLSWTTLNVGSCNASSDPFLTGWSGPKTIFGTQVIMVSEDTVFTLICQTSDALLFAEGIILEVPLSAEASTTINIQP